MAKFVAAAVLLLVVLSLSRAAVAIEDGILHDNSALIHNTEQCLPQANGKYHCEAIFTINASAQDKQLYKNLNVFITFEDRAKRNKTVRFNTDFDVGVLQPVTVTEERLVWVANETVTNGTNTSIVAVYALQNVTFLRDEIVYQNKRLVPGVNYVRLWTDDFDEEWVDWQVLIKGIPVRIDGVDAAVDFDTHKKGWAVWSLGSPPWTPITSYWSLNAAPYQDSTGQYANATVSETSPGSAAGIIGNAATFSTDSRIVIPAQGITGSSARTVSFWAYPTSTTGGGIIGWGTRSSGQWYQLFLFPGNAASAVYVSYYSYDYYCGNSVAPLPLNTWTHVAVTLPAGGNSASTKVYVNGTLVSGCTYGTIGSVNTVAGTNPYVIGNRNYALDEPFVGRIDEVAIYNRELTAAEIALLWNAGSPVTYPLSYGNFTPIYQRQVIIRWNSTHASAPSQVLNKSITISIENASFNNTARHDFGDVRVKMLNTSGNDTPWDYKLSWLNGSVANITFSVNSDNGGGFNTDEQYYLVWGNSSAVTTSNNNLPVNLTGAPTNWTFGPITSYAEGAGPTPPTANESSARQAVLAGIQESMAGSAYAAAYDRQVYIRLANGSQYKGRFDLYVTSGSKRYAFNYDQNTTASFPVFANITPVFYVWQGANMTNTSIAANVSALINATY